jgi:hypothetical protein
MPNPPLRRAKGMFLLPPIPPVLKVDKKKVF